MNIEYIKELDGNYLLLEAPQKKESFSERMLLFGRPGRFLPFRIYQEDPDRKYSYEISGRQSLAAMTMTRQITAGQIREVLQAVYRCCEEAEEYLLDPTGICLDPGLMYRGRDGWAFCYCPGFREELSEQIQRLSRFFLRKCDHGDPQTARLAYDLFQLCHEDNTTFPQILELLGEAGQTGSPAEETESRFSLRRLFRRGG